MEIKLSANLCVPFYIAPVNIAIGDFGIDYPPDFMIHEGMIIFVAYWSNGRFHKLILPERNNGNIFSIVLFGREDRYGLVKLDDLVHDQATNIQRWTSSSVDPGQIYPETVMTIIIAESALVDSRGVVPVEQNPSPLGMHGFDRGVGRFDGSPGASSRVDQGSYHRASAEHAENDLPTREPKQHLGRLSHALLSGQIVFRALLLTTLGVLFAVPGAWGVVLILDNSRRWDRLAGLALITTFFPITATFYSWAAYGDPKKVWMLGEMWRALLG